MKRISRLVLSLIIGVLATLAPVASSVSAQEMGAPMLLPVDATALTVERDGAVLARFDVEIADDSAERSRGLMFRMQFPDDRAMLFVFERTRPVAFWMHNTPRSLDMLFIRADGVLSSIATDTTPFSDAAVPSKEPVRYVLEIGAGLSARYGLRPGDRVVHPIISGSAN
ncbi:MAG: DUF192 domain-containing protein [Hyphomicrobiales bacterium]|nr:DUF192 domain-containing protein [Hyphomicrobiales bacterium]